MSGAALDAAGELFSLETLSYRLLRFLLADVPFDAAAGRCGVVEISVRRAALREALAWEKRVMLFELNLLFPALSPVEESLP